MVETKHTPTTEEEIIRFSRYEKLERAFFFINADSFSQFELWKNNEHLKGEDEKHKVEWVQDSSGFMQIIGNLYRKKGNTYEELPVGISLSFALLNDVYVCFYTSDSMASDYELVEGFVEKYAGKYSSESRTAMTNAMNFNHCVQYCISNK